MVVGLDGVPHWLLRKLADDGVMPETGRLLGQGALRPLTAPVPDISSTSWASFLTGTDPGTHGVYGFVDLVPGEYRTYFPQFPDLRAEPLWRAVDRSVVVNVPGTYPAPAMDGLLVSGFVAPDFSRAVYPPEWADRLRSRGYELDVEVGDVAADPLGFLDRIDAVLAARRGAFGELLEAVDWRLAICVITETDRVHHFLWRDLMDPVSPLHHRILEFYTRVDAAVAELADRAGDGALMIVSDHGFGSAGTQFYLNSWLREAGYLELPADAASLEDIDTGTSAFALDPGRLYLNDTSRYPRGRSLPAEERRDLLDEITARVLALRVGEDGAVTEGGPGLPVADEVLDGVELYSGRCVAAAPDLVVMPAADVQIRGAWTQPGLTAASPLTGTHTRTDATFWCRGDHGEGSVHMRDVAPTVLASMGLDPLPGMEGVDVRGRVPALGGRTP